MARTFTRASSHYLRLSQGAVGPLGPTTCWVIMRKATNPTAYAVMFGSGLTGAVNDAASWIFYCDASTTNKIGTWNGSVDRFSPFTVTAAEGWVLVAVTKASGTATQRFHKYVYSTNTWTHQDTADGTSANSGTPTIGNIVGTHWTSGGFFDGDIQNIGVVNAVLTDAQIEALPFTLNGQLAMNPVGLWMFDQSAVGQTVVDLMGRGANQSAISGTVVSAQSVPVFNYSDGIWSAVSKSAGTTHQTTAWNTSYVVRDHVTSAWNTSYVVRDHQTKTWDTSYVVRDHQTLAWASSYVTRDHQTTAWLTTYKVRDHSTLAWASSYVVRDHNANTTWQSSYVVRDHATQGWVSSYVVRDKVTVTWGSSYDVSLGPVGAPIGRPFFRFRSRSTASKIARSRKTLWVAYSKSLRAAIVPSRVTTTWNSSYAIRDHQTSSWASSYVVRDHNATTTWSSSYVVREHVTAAWASSYVVRDHQATAWASSYTVRDHVVSAWDSSYNVATSVVPVEFSSRVWRLRAKAERIKIRRARSAFLFNYSRARQVASLVPPRTTVSWSSSYVVRDHVTSAWSSSYTVTSGAANAGAAVSFRVRRYSAHGILYYRRARRAQPYTSRGALISNRSSVSWTTTYKVRDHVTQAWSTSYVARDHVVSNWSSSYIVQQPNATTWTTSYVVREHVSASWATSYRTRDHATLTWATSYVVRGHETAAWLTGYVVRDPNTSVWTSSYKVRGHEYGTWLTSYRSAAHESITWQTSYAVKVTTVPIWSTSYVVRDKQSRTWTTSYRVIGHELYVWTSSWHTESHLRLLQTIQGYGRVSRPEALPGRVSEELAPAGSIGAHNNSRGRVE